MHRNTKRLCWLGCVVDFFVTKTILHSQASDKADWQIRSQAKIHSHSSSRDQKVDKREEKREKRLCYGHCATGVNKRKRGRTNTFVPQVLSAQRLLMLRN